MIDHDTLVEVMQLGEQRRRQRRAFMKSAGIAIAAAGGASLLAACDNDDGENTPPPSPTPSPTSSISQNDIDILNFALSLEYLEANYYVSAAVGSPINAQLRTGTGTQGDVVGGRAVAFGDATVASYAREIAADENQHVVFLRNQLGAAAVAMPQINIDGGATGAFTAAARAAGVVTATGTFDPYANDDNFLLGGMLLSDVGVTAYKGAARFINSPTILEASAGILAVEAYHSGLIRTLLYRRGLTAGNNDRVNAGRISDARDTLDGTSDLDQGIIGDATTSNIVPADANGIVFGRSTGQVLSIAFLNTSANAAVTSGGFFPNGINGSIRTSSRTDNPAFT